MITKLKIYEGVSRYTKGDYLLINRETQLKESDLRDLGYHIKNKFSGIKPISISFSICTILNWRYNKNGEHDGYIVENIFSDEKFGITDDKIIKGPLTNGELSEVLTKTENIIFDNIENHNIGDFAKKYNI